MTCRAKYSAFSQCRSRKGFANSGHWSSLSCPIGFSHCFANGNENNEMCIQCIHDANGIDKKEPRNTAQLFSSLSWKKHRNHCGPTMLHTPVSPFVFWYKCISLPVSTTQASNLSSKCKIDCTNQRVLEEQWKHNHTTSGPACASRASSGSGSGFSIATSQYFRPNDSWHLGPWHVKLTF